METLRLKEIHLVDDDGNITMTLNGTHGIRLWGKDGKIRASLSVLTTDQPTLMFWHGPVPRFDLRLDEDGNPDFTLVGNRQLEIAEMCIRAWDKEDRAAQSALRASKRKHLKNVGGVGLAKNAVGNEHAE